MQLEVKVVWVAIGVESVESSESSSYGAATRLISEYYVIHK